MMELDLLEPALWGNGEGGYLLRMINWQLVKDSDILMVESKMNLKKKEEEEEQEEASIPSVVKNNLVIFFLALG